MATPVARGEEIAMLRSVLERVSLFRQLAADDFDELTAICGALDLAPDHVVYRPGDPADALYVVAEGSVVLLGDGGRQPSEVVSRLRSGDFFGELGLLDDHARSETAVAEEASVVLAIGKAELLGFLEGRSALALKLRLAAAVGHSERAKSALRIAQRRAVRHRIHREIGLTPQRGAARRATLVDLSTLGLCLKGVPAEWSEESDVSFRLDWSGGGLDLAARVVWRDRENAGLELIADSPGQPARIQAAIGRLLSDAAA